MYSKYGLRMYCPPEEEICMQKKLSLMVVMIQILILKETSLIGEFGIKINQNEYSGSAVS